MTRDAADPTYRNVELERIGHLAYRARNNRGGEITIGEGQNDDFTPVELLLTAIASCNAVTIEAIAMKRAEPLEFSMVSAGHKINDETGGSRMVDLQVNFSVVFPAGIEGEKALARMPLALEQSSKRFCTVSRTVQHGTDTTLVLEG